MNRRETQDEPRRLEAWGWGTLTIILLARIVTMAGPDVYQAAVSRPWMFLATVLGMFLAMVPYLYTGRLDALLQGGFAALLWGWVVRVVANGPSALPGWFG